MTFGGRLSRLPPVGGRSSAQEEIIRIPAGIHFGAISNNEKRNNAIKSSEMLIIRDFPVFEITSIFLVRDYLPMCIISTAISEGDTPLMRCAWPSEDGLILANF